MKSRRNARRLVLQGLCCLDVQGSSATQGVNEFILASRENPDTIAAARELLASTMTRRDECDRLLVRHAKNWELPRLALVDRNILRLAVYEMLTGQTPLKVIITEALRLGQEFSSAESPRFLNGVLDSVAREVSRDTGAQLEERPSKE